MITFFMLCRRVFYSISQSVQCIFMSKREQGFYVPKQTHVRQSPRFGTNGRSRCDFRPFFKIGFSVFWWQFAVSAFYFALGFRFSAKMKSGFRICHSMRLDVFLGKISVQVPTYYCYYYNLYFITGSLSLQVVFQ